MAKVQKVEKIWLDGKMIPWDEANVHILTHTLHYGLGVFEGVRCYECADGRSATAQRSHQPPLRFRPHPSWISPSQGRSASGCKEIFKINQLKAGYLPSSCVLGDGE
jgi:branched-chain amino acid aminotransferase